MTWKSANSFTEVEAAFDRRATVQERFAWTKIRISNLERSELFFAQTYLYLSIYNPSPLQSRKGRKHDECRLKL